MTTTSTIALPEGLTENDVTNPKWVYGKSKKAIANNKKEQINYEVGDQGRITLYYTERFGWSIKTLHIGNGRNGNADRAYGYTVNTGQLVTMGNGPHVLREIKIHLRESRVEALKKFIDLYNRGLIAAGECRDRISTRRAQTVQRRGNILGWL